MRNDRGRIIEQATPLLEPGEAVAHVVKAVEGPNRWFGMALSAGVALGLSLLVKVPFLALPVFWVVFTYMYARRLILATDRGLVVLAGGRWRYVPKSLLDRLPLDTRIGPLRGLWLATTLNGRRLFVSPRSVKEVVSADADLDDE